MKVSVGISKASNGAIVCRYNTPARKYSTAAKTLLKETVDLPGGAHMNDTGIHDSHQSNKKESVTNEAIGIVASGALKQHRKKNRIYGASMYHGRTLADSKPIS